MNKYFLDKLKKLKEQINSTSNSIITGVTEYKLNELVSLSQRLTVLKESHRELTKDTVKYCSVDEIIEIANAVNYSSEPLNLLDKYSLESTFKYDRTVTINERDKLISKFGYSLKEAKVQ